MASSKKKSAKKTAGKKSAAKKATGASAEPRMTKAAFIRSLPADMPAAEVIAKGAGVGLKLDAMAVYKTRSNARKAKGDKKSAAGKKAAPRASRAKARGKAPDKKNRVLELKAQNPDWTADQIAKAAKCSTTYVYSVWGGSKKAGPTNGTARAAGHASQHLDHVRALRGVILHVGIDRAKEMMDQIVRDLMVEV